MEQGPVMADSNGTDLAGAADGDGVEKNAGHPAFTWYLSLSYDGTAYHGWQIQPGQCTVQGQLQERLRRLFRDNELRTVGSSRTDAGVHALDQRVSFEATFPGELDSEQLKFILNRWLPDDILVNWAEERPPGFSARFDNHGKAYTYVIATKRLSPLFTRFAWPYHRPLDTGAMAEAALLLEGEQNFQSFAVNPKREIESWVRRLHRVQVLECDGLVCVNVVGESFLYKMVRSIVGWLVCVGAGRARPADTTTVLAARNRCAAAESAPSQGLFLARVFSAVDEWQDYTADIPPFAWRH